MLKIFEYLKYLGLFCLFIIGIALFTSIISLTSMSTPLINKLSIILTAISFFIIVTLASHKISEKGYILGLKLGLIFIIMLILINSFLFHSKFTLDRLIYYIILLTSGILGGSFGKNINFPSKHQK